VSSLMVEVNRRLYMDEGTGEELAAFNDVPSLLRECLGLTP